jgi:hypothetical protein
MIEFREGYTDQMAEMVLKTLRGLEHFKEKLLQNRESQLDNTKKFLKSMAWLCAGYEDGKCVTALWGKDEYINIIVDPCYKGKWATRRLLLQFFRYFFGKYQVAKVNKDMETQLPENFWERLGFKNGEMTWEQLPKLLKV